MWYFGWRQMDKKEPSHSDKEDVLKLNVLIYHRGRDTHGSSGRDQLLSRVNRIWSAKSKSFLIALWDQTFISNPDSGSRYKLCHISFRWQTFMSLGSTPVLFALCRELCSSAPSPPPSSPSNLFHVKCSVMGSMEIMPQYRGYWEIYFVV